VRHLRAGKAAIGLAAASVAVLAFAAHAAPAGKPAASGEQAVAAIVAKLADDPLALHQFLRPMPKGGDLHNHLSGAIWAEDYIAWGAQAGYCASADGLTVVPPPCPPERALSRPQPQGSDAPSRLIDSFSTRGWQLGVGRNERSGHDQFFQTFGQFAPIAHIATGKMLAAVRRNAALEQVSYLELDHNTEALASHIMGAPPKGMTEAEIPALYAEELAALGPVMDKAQLELTGDEAEAERLLACQSAAPQPACKVKVHYLWQAMRALPARQVFRSLVAAFAMADRDPRYVGMNIVMPEDAELALADYDLHMAMIRFLSAKYPKVRRTLHAGEMAPGLVAPQHMQDHIAKAIAAGAERIGHGVDIGYEANSRQTLAEMARHHVAVEINLSSNDVILGVKGKGHPLGLYRRAGVPFVLSTDDAGVLRTDMTREYVRAVREQGLTYGELKQAARASLEHSFLRGPSLWAGGRIGAVAAGCKASFTVESCTKLLDASEKAKAQADLEMRFAVFERGVNAMAAPKSKGFAP